MVHVVYCDDKEKVLEKILDGSKTMAVRGASGRKIPHSRVFKGESLYFMKKGTGKITAKTATSQQSSTFWTARWKRQVISFSK